MERVRRIGVQDAQSSAVIVSERSVGLVCCWACAADGSGRWSIGKHYGAPYRRVTEAEEVTKFVSEHGFEVVSLRRRGECLRRRKRGIRISRAEVDIRIENLTKFRGNCAAADLDAGDVCGDDPGERQNAGCEGHVHLVKADGVEAVCATGVLRGRSGQGRESSRQQESAAYAGPHREGLGYGLFDFAEASACGLILRQNGYGVRVQHGAPLDGDASRCG